jgi:hypothetical protein
MNVISQRKVATEKGMRGNENQWGYGQLLSVLLLVPLVSAVINPFFGKYLNCITACNMGMLADTI